MNTNPEHLHVILNHLPLIGFAAAVVPLLIGWVWKSRASLNAGLLLVVIAAATAPAVMWSGEEAYERFETDPALKAVLDDTGDAWMHEHEEQAELAIWWVYGTGLVGLVALLLGLKGGKFGRKLAFVTMLGCVISLPAMAWVANSGGMVRHAEFRPGFSEDNPTGDLPPSYREEPHDGDEEHDAAEH